MNRFSYFEDFNNEVKRKFENTGFQEMYIIGIKIVFYKNLESDNKSYLSNKKSNSKFNDLDNIVKYYSSKSFYYKNTSSGVESSKMTIREKLFGKTITPVISLSALESNIKENEEKGWHYKINENKSIIIIVKKNTDVCDFEKLFNEIFELHRNYDLSSLNARNMSIKKNNSIVEQFRKEVFTIKNETYNSGFQPSLETTLLNIVQFIFGKYSKNKQLSLISLLKLSVNNDSKLYWDNFYHNECRGNFENNTFIKIVSNEIDNCYFYKNIEDANHVNYADLKDFPVPIGFSTNGDYYLIIPISKTMERIQFRYAIILRDSKPFETYIFFLSKSLHCKLRFKISK